ncbi:glycosyltransferase family 4 protein [Peribacillus deserti]|uniref:Glycosyltransferase family 1 protein n=1 Tax=Peribacillus deserti TaxID=673318 RepID=A0A2N5M4A9_9BACI|nr:glycosyltransferase family 4 protein [Peribacillus deserti]PLT29199.1 glycosyltransferase family 1 protein [Peribacillus deserti]
MLITFENSIKSYYEGTKRISITKQLEEELFSLIGLSKEILLTEDTAPESHIFTSLKKERVHTILERAVSKSSDQKSLNILMLTWEFPPHVIGGLSRHVFGLAKAMSDMGHHIHVLTVQQENTSEYEVLDDISVHRVTPLTSGDSSFLDWTACLNVAMADKIREICLEEAIDLIHAHDWLVAAAASTAVRHENTGLAVTIHSTEYGRNNGIYNELQKKIHRQEEQLIAAADKVIVCSEYMKDELKTVFQCEDEDLVMLPNGITEEEVLSLADTDFSRYIADRDFPIIYSWGRVVREKGFQTLIKAVALLKNKQNKVHLIISGKGPYLPFLKNLAREKGVQDYVTFTGFIPDEERNAILRKSIAAVFPSDYEPFGIVALEAMAAAKPVIAAKTGGLKCIFKHMEEGYHFNPGNEVQLAEWIEFLLKNPEEANKTAVQGRQAALTLYNWGKIGKETEAVYRKILMDRCLRKEGGKHENK